MVCNKNTAAELVSKDIQMMLLLVPCKISIKEIKGEAFFGLMIFRVLGQHLFREREKNGRILFGGYVR